MNKLLTAEPVLTHYNPTVPVKLACDASPMGWVQFYVTLCPMVQKKTIAFASISLMKAERNYAQIDKEAVN